MSSGSTIDHYASKQIVSKPQLVSLGLLLSKFH